MAEVVQKGVLVDRVLDFRYFGKIVDLEPFDLVPVQEVPYGEQRAQYPPEGLVGPQELDPLLEVHQGLGDLPFGVLEVQLEGPQFEPRRQLGDRRQGQEELLRAPQRQVRIGRLRLLYLGPLLFGGQHRQQLLDPFAVHYGGVHFQDGGLDRSGRRQLGHADVDGVGALRVQHDDLLVLVHLLLFLGEGHDQSAVRFGGKPEREIERAGVPQPFTML